MNAGLVRGGAGGPPEDAAPAMLETFEAEARCWCRDRGIDPDGRAPGIMVGPLGFTPEKYWIRRARQISLAEQDRQAEARRPPPPRRGDA